MTLHHYRRRIEQILSSLHQTSETALPANRALVNDYLASDTNLMVELLIAGIRKDAEEFTWDEGLWTRFKPHIEAEEFRLRHQLDYFLYQIDASDTLELITGPGRIDKVSLALVQERRLGADSYPYLSLLSLFSLCFAFS